MKKYVILLCVFLMPFCAFADENLVAMGGPFCMQLIGGSTPVAGAACDSCAGANQVVAHFENNDDLTVGTPCGCSDGDTTFTLSGGVSYTSGSPYDGSYNLTIDGSGNDYARLVPSARDIFNENDFKVTIILQVSTWADGAVIWHAYQASGTEDFRIYTSGSSSAISFKVQMITNAGGEWDYLTVTTSRGQGEWIRVVFEGKVQAGNDAQLTVSDADGSNPDTPDVQDFDWGAFPSTAVALDLGIDAAAVLNGIIGYYKIEAASSL